MLRQPLLAPSSPRTGDDRRPPSQPRWRRTFGERNQTHGTGDEDVPLPAGGGVRAAGTKAAATTPDGHEPTDTMPQSAAAPSPFPPIADYAFLSDCHTGALIAPDGAVGWLCVPRFDAPSVFGTLLDRQAGYFRVGPFGM